MLCPQWCPTVWDPMVCSPPGSSLHGILQVRLLEWVAISSSRGSSQSMDWTCISYVPCIASGVFITEPLGKAPKGLWKTKNNNGSWQSRDDWKLWNPEKWISSLLNYSQFLTSELPSSKKARFHLKWTCLWRSLHMKAKHLGFSLA